MGVFADADEGDVDRVGFDDGAEALAFGLGVFFGVDVVEGGEGEGEFGDEALPEVEAEAGGVGDGEADVFVEVEGGDAGPVDVFFVDERGEHFELGGAGGDDDVGGAAGGEGGADFGGTVGGGAFA